MVCKLRLACLLVASCVQVLENFPVNCCSETHWPYCTTNDQLHLFVVVEEKCYCYVHHVEYLKKFYLGYYRCVNKTLVWNKVKVSLRVFHVLVLKRIIVYVLTNKIRIWSHTIYIIRCTGVKM